MSQEGIIFTMNNKSAFTLTPSWQKVLNEELQKPYLQKLSAFIAAERQRGTQIYPPDDQIFAAFTKTPFDKVKVVIVGQDPYHGAGQANGLSFSVNEGVPLPPSLKNIFKELKEDVEKPVSKNGSLAHWAEQGVFLLNVTLTVAEGDPLSHHKKGWEQFTDAVLEALCQRQAPLVFLLWGKNAQDKCAQLNTHHQSEHLILTAAHPSPFSAYRGFFGCHHFSKTNAFLIEQHLAPIEW